MQNEDCQKNVNGKVSLDLKLLKQKQQLLIQYYEIEQQQAILNILSEWPNQQIQQHIKTDRVLHRTGNAQYVGQTCNQMFHGYGLLLYNQPRGRFYQGQFQNNCKHGDGLQFIGGDVYVGKFVNNKPQHQNGVFMWKNGDLYIGGFVNGMKHGKGRWESAPDYYEGTWKLNNPQGIGKIHTNSSQYQGHIRKGYKHGYGKQIFSNGDIYEGSYANGKPQGDGIYKWNNGAIYKGQFKNGIRYGYGEWNFGKQKYEGEYVNDRRNGQGIYKWGIESYYKGQFVDDMRHGVGQMHWSDNTFYRGSWKEGIQAGQGQLWENGELVSKGQFQQGKLIKKTNQPPKLLKSRYQKSQKNDSELRNSNTTKSNQTKYPMIDRRKKLRSSSYYTNLGQIQENNNNSSQQKSKKQSVATSFSHHQHSHKTSTATKKSTHVNIPKTRIKQTIYLPQQTQQKKFVTNKNNPSSKKLQQTQRMKDIKVGSMMGHNLHGSNNRTGVVDMSDTQLGPIKWKNFRHMNGYRNSVEASNLPQI